MLPEASEVGPSPDVLYVTHRVPYPPDKGDRIRNYHVLRWLAHRATVHLACLADEPVTPEQRGALGSLCARVAIAPVGGYRRRLRIGTSLVRGQTASEGAFWSPSLAATLERWVAGTSFRSVLISASSLVPYLRLGALRDLPAVVDLMDVDSQKWFDLAARSPWPRSWLYRLEGRRLRRVEHEAADRAQAVTLVSEAEVGLYRRTVRPDGPIHAIPNGVDLDSFRPLPPPGGVERGCVFVGAMDYAPNVDAVCWFAREVWPEVQGQSPTATFRIVGRNPVEAVRRLATIPGIEVTGTVPDVRPDLVAAAVVVAPLRIARGVQNKVLEALAMGKAVVASPQALAGLRAEPGVHLICASSPGAWTKAMMRLQDDSALRRRLGEAGRHYIEQHHHWRTCLEPLGTLLGLTEAAPFALPAGVSPAPASSC